MFWDGNQECSNLCLVLAGVLSTLPVFLFFFFSKSLGILSGLGRVGLLWFWTSLRGQGCVYTQGKRPQDAVPGVLLPRMELSVEQLLSLHCTSSEVMAAGCSEVMLSGCGENPPG